MKKVFFFILVLALLLICATALADEQEGLYTYKVNEDNTVTITGFDWKNNHGDIYIPEMLGNRMVSAIGESAFATTGNTAVKNTAVKITLPDNIKSIGAQAFRGVSITYVNIPLNTVEIGGGAFAQCSVMRFNVAEGHTVFATIENSLYNKQTKTLIAWPRNKDIDKIPYGIKSIGDYVFYGRSYSSMESFTLPQTIETIGEYAFAKARNALTPLNMPNVKTIGAHAFEEALVNLNSPRLSVIGDYAFYKAEVNFLSQLSLSQVGKHAFEESQFELYNSGDRNNHEYLLSRTPYKIEEYAFAHSYVIDTRRYYNSDRFSDSRTISLKNVTSIGAHAFEGIKSKYSSLDSELYFQLDEGALVNVTYLGENAFYETSINSWRRAAYVDLTNPYLTSIPKGAFYSTKITYLKIGPSITEIGEGAFQKCDKLQRVELVDGLLIINDYAFSGCKELTAISIPASVTMIGNDVFSGCPGTFVVTVEPGSYGEVWARTCGYAYVVNGQVEDTSWLND